MTLLKTDPSIVLVVDDSKTQSSFIKKILDDDYETVVASSGLEGLEIYKEIYEGNLITVPRGDTAALATAITKNMNRYQDLEFTDSLVEFSKKFDFRRTAEMVLDG